MTTATLTFALPEERSAHLAAVHAVQIVSALRDVDTYLRQLLTHDGIQNIHSRRLAEEIRCMIADELALMEE